MVVLLEWFVYYLTQLLFTNVTISEEEWHNASRASKKINGYECQCEVTLGQMQTCSRERSFLVLVFFTKRKIVFFEWRTESNFCPDRSAVTTLSPNIQLPHPTDFLWCVRGWSNLLLQSLDGQPSLQNPFFLHSFLVCEETFCRQRLFRPFIIATINLSLSVWLYSKNFAVLRCLPF